VLAQVYTLFHRALHHRAVYACVHKHHHKQKAPSRGNLDAINVHPLEFICGEYLHLACVYAVPCHAYAAAVFLAAGGVFASLNHTRFDVNFLTAAVYNVKVVIY
jgi:sterol desaturase/sphingolipid hydroxylase (fatty acid hydroxylase superfamily)